jgi:hypothetical protein
LASGYRLSLSPGEARIVHHLLSAHLDESLYGYEIDLADDMVRTFARYLDGTKTKEVPPHEAYRQIPLPEFDEPAP